ncbi:MAG: hypothetical protein ACXWJB_14270 [Limisphaerales bacterium]
MKRVKNCLGMVLATAALFATVGCDHIRDYSVNSYQGVMPVNDFRPAGSGTVTIIHSNPALNQPPQSEWPQRPL